MMKSIGKLTLATILAALVVGVPLGAMAEDAPAASTNSAPAAPAKPKSTAFRGTLGAVDKTAKTIEVDNKSGNKRTFDITSDTVIKRSGKAATLEDAVVGDMVSGSWMKTDDGKTVAKTVNLKPAAAATK